MADGDPRDPSAAVVARGAGERLTFFSDAVVAIAITLLALGLPVPEGGTAAEVLRSLADRRYEYLAFLVGFLVVAAHWRGRPPPFPRAGGGHPPPGPPSPPPVAPF